MSESDTLLLLADRLNAHAATVRARAHRLGLSSEQVRWHSAAADSFRTRACDSAVSLHRSAGGLDDAARALRRHARAVRRLEEVAGALGDAGVAVAGTVATITRAIPNPF